MSTTLHTNTAANSMIYEDSIAPPPNQLMESVILNDPYNIVHLFLSPHIKEHRDKTKTINGIVVEDFYRDLQKEYGNTKEVKSPIKKAIRKFIRTNNLLVYGGKFQWTLTRALVWEGMILIGALQLPICSC
jgi:L-fucose mutarotase/ribose pyranase (RbsD/FucU family)